MHEELFFLLNMQKIYQFRPNSLRCSKPDQGAEGCRGQKITPTCIMCIYLEDFLAQKLYKSALIFMIGISTRSEWARQGTKKWSKFLQIQQKMS